jgi:hypothetical protein
MEFLFSYPNGWIDKERKSLWLQDEWLFPSVLPKQAF